MNVLSLFDGMSCGQIAFDKLGIKFDGNKNKYFASEIKKSAIKVTKHNYPNTIHIGDVTKVSYSNGVLYTENGEYEVGEIDYLIGGSPCQDFSCAKLQAAKDKYGLEGDKSKLFYEYLRLLKEINPKYFLLENVRMKEDSKKQLDKYLGVEGRYINSIDFSFQNRPRFYWTDINILPYEAKNINFQDYKDTDYEYCKQFKVNKTMSRLKMWNNGNGTNNIKTGCANVSNSEKIFCLTRFQDRCPNSGLIEFEDFCRFLTRRELELAQTVPVGYTNCLSYNQAQDVLGDGWTVDVIVHILKSSLNTEPIKTRLGNIECEQLKWII